ncbi:ribbon-helix-helix domain-containing protein [Salidesulfovibrio onnuriiensis]|uniref:ribbon-helix-helix domain-containing protein n=1 Tax=Salidesulfovibrio onnuriiensis TaxID=2583823 RepID=UPI0011CA97F5|nr:ribbon-helix-helix domain-containing protein [Salidesulfovibrio onnuriiensis]
MCELYSSTPPTEYETQTRSVRLNGAVSSVRLEQRFWNILEELAESEGTTLGRFLSTLHDEATRTHGDIGNFASLLRVACTTYLHHRSA